MEAKRAGKKDAALRLLGQIQSLKTRVRKLSDYTMLMHRQQVNLDSAEIDTQMADIFDTAVRSQERRAHARTRPDGTRH